MTTAGNIVRVNDLKMYSNVWGDRDQFQPVEQGVTLYRRLPNAQLAVIPDADHSVTRTHQAEFGQLVTNFFEALLQRETK